MALRNPNKVGTETTTDWEPDSDFIEVTEIVEAHCQAALDQIAKGDWSVSSNGNALLFTLGKGDYTKTKAGEDVMSSMTFCIINPANQQAFGNRVTKKLKGFKKLKA
jgi:hypothetical protein